MKALKTVLIVLLVQVALGIAGLVAYFELRTPGPTFANDADIGDNISFQAGSL